MIINEENKDSFMFKGTMLRGFNNTPSNIRDNIVKDNLKLKRYNQNIAGDKKEEEKFDPKKQKELTEKMDRINK